MMVKFRNCWLTIALWLAVDLVMALVGHALPEWMTFDPKRGFEHDLYLIFFVAWMWITARESEAKR